MQRDLQEPCKRSVRLDRYGYGVVYDRAHGGPRRATRVAWEGEYGPIEGGLFVLHHCDHPWCEELTHLYLGDAADNARDRVERGRGHDLRGIKNPASKLTESTVAEMRRLRATGALVKDIARQFGVHPSVASRATRGETWSHAKG